jgi:membrane protein YqaA with SNARE-associated domain
LQYKVRTATSALLILFVWSFAAATILPLSSELPLAVAIRQDADWRLAVLVATAGNYLGACTTFLLARAAAKRFTADPRQRARHAAALLRRFGPPALLLSWVPVIGDVLVALAGAAGIPFAQFSIWTLAGKAGRYLAIAWLASS